MKLIEENDVNKYCVYVHTNILNGKRYVGQTGQNQKIRWGNNGKGYRKCTHFWNAIEKYGWENFNHDILVEGISQEQADEMERMFIHQWKTNDPQFGYNLDSGGSLNKHHSQETKEKMRIKASNMSQEHRDKLREAATGRKLSDDVIQKIKDSKTGHKMSEETRRKMSESKKGYVPSDEHRKHLSESKVGEKNPNACPVDVYTKDGVFLGRYATATEAHLVFGVAICNICRCMRGERKTAGGYIWRPAQL